MTNIIRARITNAAVDRLRAGDIVRDTELKGLGVRHQCGQLSYFLAQEGPGRGHWLTIGPHGSPLPTSRLGSQVA
jgi:hypothetical protein